MNNIETKFFLGVLLLASVLLKHNEVLAANEVDLVKEAITRRLCYESYWQHGPDVSAKRLPIIIKIDKEKFNAWIKELYVDKAGIMEGTYEGILEDGNAIVVNSGGSIVNYSFMKKKEFWSDSDNKSINRDTLIIPFDCTPNYDTSTPKKELMLRTIISTIQKNFRDFARLNNSKYQNEVTVLIADFNIDYQSTFVLVKGTDDLYFITLHDMQNYYNDEYEKNGEYPLGEVFNKPKNLLEKVKKHAIEKIVPIMK